MNYQRMVFGLPLWGVLALNAQQAPKDSTALQLLDEVVVSDSRFELKREQSGKTVIRIDRDELSKNQGRTVADLLNTKSGIEIAGGRGRQGEVLGVYARGGRGRQVLVLIDGIRVSDPSSSAQEYDLRLLTTDEIESIEIIKGASSTLYGTNAATAVINISTKKAGDKKIAGTFQSSAGTNQAYNDQDYSIAAFRNSAHIGGTLGLLDYSAGISQAYSDHLSSLVTASNEEDPFSSYIASISLGYRLSGQFRIRVYGNKSTFKTAFDESFGLTDAPYHYSTEQKRVGTALQATYPKGEISLNAALTEFYSENRSAFPGSFDGRSQVVDIYNKYSFNEFLHAILGLNYLKDQAVFGEHREFTLADPYINLVYLSNFGLNLNAGFRLNTHSEYGNQEVYSVNPSFSIPWDAGYLKLMTSYATSYITPSLVQLFGEFGANPELEPETNRTFEAGLEWVKSNILRASILYFNRNEAHFVFFDSAEFLYRNATSDIQARGVELEATWRPFPHARLEANYTFTERNGDDAIRIPQHKVNMLLGVDLGKHTYGSLQYAYTGNRPDTDFNTFTEVTLDAFSLVNLHVSHELIAGKLKGFLNADNLLNASYTEILGFSTRGRNLMLGFNLTL